MQSTFHGVHNRVDASNNDSTYGGRRDAASLAIDDTSPSYQITPADRRAFLRTLRVTPEQVREAAAVEQRTPEWHRWRQGRLSASNFGAAVGNSPYATMGDLLQSMLWPQKIEGEALVYGTTMESTAFRIVAQRVSHHLRTQLGYESCWIEETGTLICLEHPWLSVSSDGLLFAAAGPAMPERPLLRGTIELKAPMRKEFYNTTPHHYYDQFMGAAALLGVEFVVFGVYEPEATQIDYFTFDRDYWERSLYPGLYHFYMDLFVPRAILKARGLIAPGNLDVVQLIVPPLSLQSDTGAARKRARAVEVPTNQESRSKRARSEDTALAAPHTIADAEKIGAPIGPTSLQPQPLRQHAYDGMD